MTRRWPTTGTGGEAANSQCWTAPGGVRSSHNRDAVRYAAVCCSTPTANHKPQTTGNSGPR